MFRLHHLTLALGSLLVGLACRQIAEVSESAELQRALATHFPDTHVQVAWVNGLHHIEVDLDGPSFNALPDSEIRPRAAGIARLTLSSFPARRPPDTITVAFVTAHLPGQISATRLVSVSFPSSAIPQ